MALDRSAHGQDAQHFTAPKAAVIEPTPCLQQPAPPQGSKDGAVRRGVWWPERRCPRIPYSILRALQKRACTCRCCSFSCRSTRLDSARVALALNSAASCSNSLMRPLSFRAALHNSCIYHPCRQAERQACGQQPTIRQGLMQVDRPPDRAARVGIRAYTHAVEDVGRLQFCTCFV